MAYRRTVFDRVGEFDERFDACEDVELNHRIDRAGLRCFFTPAVRVLYFPRSSLRGLFHQMARYGRGRVRLLRKHPETFSPGGFIPAAWLAGLAPDRWPGSSAATLVGLWQPGRGSMQQPSRQPRRRSRCDTASPDSSAGSPWSS